MGQQFRPSFRLWVLTLIQLSPSMAAAFRVDSVKVKTMNSDRKRQINVWRVVGWNNKKRLDATPLWRRQAELDVLGQGRTDWNSKLRVDKT